MSRQTIGEVAITTVEESRFTFPCDLLLPGSSRKELAAIEWLGNPYATPGGELQLAVQAFVVETPDRRIVIDTCMGNDKQRSGGVGHMLATDFLDRLSAAGYPRESIDVVLCTHLHVDHVGWNTMLDDDCRWVPTFPNARYLIGRTEFDYWRASQDGDAPNIFADSIRPLLDVGLVDLVEADHVIDRCVRLVPSPGHTPGHVSVAIVSGEAEALITGDAFHSPAQVARPEWAAFVDYDRDASTATRRRLLDELGDTGTRVFGTHFPAPTCGSIVREGGGFRFVS